MLNAARSLTSLKIQDPGQVLFYYASIGRGGSIKLEPSESQLIHHILTCSGRDDAHLKSLPTDSTSRFSLLFRQVICNCTSMPDGLNLLDAASMISCMGPPMDPHCCDAGPLATRCLAIGSNTGGSITMESYDVGTETWSARSAPKHAGIQFRDD